MAQNKALRITITFVLLAFFPLPLLAWIDASVVCTIGYARNAAGQYVPEPALSWHVNPSSLHFHTNAAKAIIARMRTDIVFADDEGILQEDHFILQTPPRADVAGLATIRIHEQRRFKLEGPVKGKVKVYFMLTDLADTSSTYSYTDSMDMAVEMDKPFFAGVVIQTADTGSSLPLPANFLDDDKRTLYYRTTLFNVVPATVGADRYPLATRVAISKKPGDVFLPGFETADTFRKEVVPAVHGSMPIGRLISGNYYLNVQLEDRNGTVLASRSTFFQRLNAHPEKAETGPATMKEVLKDTGMERVTFVNLEKTFLAKYNVPQLKAMLKMLLPLSDGMEANTINGFLKKPDEMYIRYYILNHYQAINAKNPEKAWKEYSEKIAEVNRKFSANGVPGYETERGFIYLRYGKPTDVITVTGELGALPYEIWQYNTLVQFGNKKELANALFLFFKPSRNLADYRLLHSTVPGETVNLGWRSYLYTGNRAADAGFSMNSRADQYFGSR